jgi:hypothetical protein
MLTKVAILFLAGMVLLALVGRALFPGALRLRRGSAARPAKCPSCGRFMIGKAPCDCGGARRKLIG